MADLGALELVLRRTARRIRLGRVIAWLGHGLTLGLGLAAMHEAWARSRGLGPRYLVDAGLVLLALLIVSVVRFAMRVAREEAAARLDQSHDLHDRVRSAVEFAHLPASERTRFMEAALRDSLARARELSAERAVVFGRPRGAAYGLVPLAVWCAVVLWPATEAAAVSPTSPRRARVLDEDDLDAFRSELAALQQEAELTPEARADVSRYNTLLERLATGELDREKALEALLSLEKKLMEGGEKHDAEDRAALNELARDLARADEALAKALEAEDQAAQAAEAMKKLAERQKNGELSAEEEKRLAEALERIRKREDERQKDRDREDELESLLKKKEQEKPPSDPEEKSLFDKQRRELERLRRDNAEAKKRHRELERLSRDLADGARPESSGGKPERERENDALQRGAEDLRRYGQDNLTQQQQRELARQVQQLREMMQRQSEQQQGGQGQRGQQGQDQNGQGSRAQRFRLRAQGQDPNDSQVVMRKPGQQGEGKEGEPGEGDDTKQGQGPQGQGEQGQAEGKQGQGENKGQGQANVLELGGDGPPEGILELPGQGETERVAGGSGDEHDETTLKSPTKLDARHDDSRLEGTAGKGATRSEVILDAADRGFTHSGYRKVYTDYQNHAEDVLERDRVPPGYRFYVRRYFQLIRPRGQKEAP